MPHIVAIGGGEIGRPGYPVETLSIDKEIIKLTKKRKPRLLFLPTASKDDQGYINVVNQHFGKRLGCITDVFCIYGKPSMGEAKSAINKADIIYVGGGNTLNMMMQWRKQGFDKLLVEAFETNKVLAGISAGAICWFKGGLSDSRHYTRNGKTQNYIRVKGLAFKNLIICPHYSNEVARKEALKQILKTTDNIAIALDNCTALEIVNNDYRIITSKPNTNGYKAYWHNGQYCLEKLDVSQKLTSLDRILNK